MDKEIRGFISSYWDYFESFVWENFDREKGKDILSVFRTKIFMEENVLEGSEEVSC